MQDKVKKLTEKLAKLEAEPSVNIHHKIDTMVELAWEMRDSDAHRALALSTAAHSLSQQENYAKGYAHSLKNLTTINSFTLSNLDIALAQASEALELPEVQNDPGLKSVVLSSMACVYAELTEYGQALDYNNQVIALCEESGDMDYLTFAINDIGLIYFDTKDYARAIKAYEHVLRLAESNDIVRMQATAQTNIGEVLIRQHKYVKAKQRLHIALHLFQQLEIYFAQALTLNYLAQIYTAENDLDKAIKTLQEGQEIISVFGDSYGLAEIFMDLGRVYQKQGRAAEALDNLQRGLETAVSANSKRHILQGHQRIAEFYEGQKSWAQALQHYKQYQALKDTIFNEQADRKLKTLQVIFETKTAKRKTELYRLKANELERKVTERTQELQEAYKQLSELDHLKSKFIRDISHELRTPLSTFSLYLSLLSEQSAKNEQYVAILKHQMGHLTKLTESITNLSVLDLEQGKQSMVEIDLNKILQQIILRKQHQITGRGLSISFNPHPTPLLVYGYHEELTTLTEHIINNAINYTPEGEIIIQVTIDDDLRHACLKVKDTGIGIRKEDMPHIFERFYRGKGASLSNIPGPGLGLTIVKGIVMLHNGSIDVQSTPGAGAEVRVCLPLISAAVNS